MYAFKKKQQLAVCGVFFVLRIVSMRVDRIGSDIPVYDLSVIRNLWESRVKKYKQRQKKEQERVNKSALAK